MGLSGNEKPATYVFVLKQREGLPAKEDVAVGCLGVGLCREQSRETRSASAPHTEKKDTQATGTWSSSPQMWGVRVGNGQRTELTFHSWRGSSTARWALALDGVATGFTVISGRRAGAAPARGGRLVVDGDKEAGERIVERQVSMKQERRRERGHTSRGHRAVVTKGLLWGALENEGQGCSGVLLRMGGRDAGERRCAQRLCADARRADML